MRRLILSILILLLPCVLLADTFPSQERGFQAEKAFHVGDFDTVNLFNGNLVLTIPIGGSYPVSSALSYGLTLAYNSNVWDYQEDDNGVYNQALPNRHSNAGLGWRLSLGELLEPLDPQNDNGLWVFIGADGAEHVFYDTLHENETAATGVRYTRDGSYLRFRFLTSATRAVEFPDGQMQTYTRQAAYDWRLTRIEDRFGNWVSVSYTNDDQGKATSWTILDQHGRSQTVNLTTASYYGYVVESVVLKGFGGAPAAYTFNYLSLNIPPACPNDDPEIDGYQVPILTSVTLPDNSSYSMPSSDYYLDKSVDCRLPGVLKGITTPVLGRIEWTYGGYGFPTGSGEKPWRKISAGVTSRTLRNHAGTAVGTWTYTPSLNPLPSPQQLAREAVRTVITPLGDKTESFFSVALDDVYTDWTKFDYGLPFTRFVTDGGSQFLSTRTWDCDGGAVNCVLKRSTYVAYERDEGFLDATFQTNMDRNRRVSATKTVYEDDSGKYEAAVFSNFDGLGHYRQTNLSGTFDAGNTATLVTKYNAGRGAYPGSFVMLNASEPWVLGTYTEQTRTEGGATAKTEHCFDAATGFLLRTRTLKTGTTQGVNDVAAVFSSTDVTGTDGNLKREEYYGGDNLTIGTGDLCSLSLSGSQYRIDHAWQYGIRSASQYYDAAGNALSFKSLDTDIDKFSGLVKTSRDTSLLDTSYEYDTMGRLTAVKPKAGHDGWTIYNYSRSLGANSPAQVQILRQPNGGGAALAESIVKYDSFGRVWQEHTKMPDGTWSIRQTNYNPLHWKTQVSEQGNTSKKTEYLNYDPFGRPGTIRPPDGSSHDVGFSYLGVRKVSRTSRVGNSIVGSTINEVLSTTQEFYDRQGRLYQVREQADANGTDTTTTYSYDVGNRLSRVQQATSAGTQNRFFTYDNRGFLTSEQHPEKGTDAAGNGKVTYSKYDARGHAGRKIDGPNDLTFTYDRAERLTQVNVTGGNLLKVFNYGSSNAAGVRTNGRLASALRYNYVGAPFNATVLLTETYTYGGRQGRVSNRTTQMTFNGTPSESFSQSWAWNELGDLGNLSYPVCQFPACVPVARALSPGYTNGFLTSVPGWATLSYHANGMVNQVTHANTVVDTQANDPDSMRRPASISAAKNGTTLWTSGAYSYDASGNVVKTGSGYYLYDRVSRLIEGRVYDGPTGAGTQKWQSYSYDPFGNILSIGGTSGRATPTSSATNRLNGTGTTYDTAGNLTAWNGNTYQYDAFNQMTRMKSGAEEWIYTYTAGDERFWSYRLGGGGSLWALRDLDGRLLREYEAHVNWSTYRDYIYRGTQLLASSHPIEGDRHFSLDHLGTPRLITNSAGTQVAYHVYYPFGEEATAFNQDAEQVKFTGHERDLASLAGVGDDLDYMHARHNSPLSGRFTSTDWIGGQPSLPQSWNRYTYATGRPLIFTDPNGEFVFAVVAVPVLAIGTIAAIYHVVQMETNSEYREAVMSLGNSLILSKQTGRQIPTNLEGYTVEELQAKLKEAEGKIAQDIVKALKHLGARNKQKARGGKREPKKPASQFSVTEIDSWLSEGVAELDALSESDLRMLFTVIDIVNVNQERDAVCGVGVVSCPF